jgi:hypothetical protein
MIVVGGGFAVIRGSGVADVATDGLVTEGEGTDVVGGTGTARPSSGTTALPHPVIRTTTIASAPPLRALPEPSRRTNPA